MWHGNKDVTERVRARPSSLEGDTNTNGDANSPQTGRGREVLQLEDDIGPPLPFVDPIDIPDSEVKARKKEMRVEQINDEVYPANPTSMEMIGGVRNFKKTKGKGAVEEIHDNVGPDLDFVPDADIDKKRKASPSHEQKAVGLGSPMVPFHVGEKFDGDCLPNQNCREECESVSAPRNDDFLDIDPQSNLRTPANIRHRNIMNMNAETSAATQPEVERESSVPIIPNAVLVEEDGGGMRDMVISGYAEPMPPWWKQRRTQQLLALVAIVIVVAAVGIGLALGLRPEPTESFSGNIMGLIPTSSPTSCSYRISMNLQTLDNLPVDEPGYSVIAADKSNMLVATRDIKYTESIYLIFYAWDGDRWELKNFIIEEVDGNGLLFSADISGGMALVGFPRAGSDSGIVYAYNQNSIKFWGKSAFPLLPDDVLGTRFGDSVHLDSDLACVSAEGDGQGSYVYVFRLEGDEWVQDDAIGPFDFVDDCLIAGETIIVKIYGGYLNLYRYVRTLKKVESLQERIGVSDHTVKRIGAATLSETHLLYAIEEFNFVDGWRPEEVLAYQRQDSGLFTLTQQLNTSDFDKEFGRALDLGGDFLVVRGLNKTYAFAEQNDIWEEQEVMIDKSYKSLQIAGRSIVAMTQTSEIVSFNVEGCIHPMPTENPSMSSAPSPLSSVAPSAITSLPSSFPTTSFTPTESCYWVELLLVFDPYPNELSWEVRKLSESGVGTVVKTQDGTGADYSADERAQERFCLQEGLYQLILRDSGGDGMCCLYGLGGYKLSSEGIILAEGGDFESSETLSFDIPVSSAPTPLSRPAPSTMESFPSSFPTISFTPSEPCYWVELLLVYDPHPVEMSWELLKMSENEVGTVVKTQDGADGDERAEERFCLQEGLYQLVLRDSGGDGMCCIYGSGSYKLSSEGIILAQGGDFESSETLSFGIPAPIVTTAPDGRAPADVCDGYNRKQCVKDSERCVYDEEEGICYQIKQEPAQ